MSEDFHNVEVPGAQSAHRLLDVLTELSLYPAGVGLSELAGSTGLSLSTARRLLLVLCDRGFAEQDDTTRAYRLGPATRMLGSRQIDPQVLRELFHDRLLDLRTATTETVFFSVRDGLHVVYVECLPAPHPVKMYGEPGTRLPLHATSQGKAILAHVPTLMFERLIRQMEFQEFTANTIGSREELIEDIERVRERGYALNVEEREPGVVSVAAPVLDPSGQAVAAVCVGAPRMRVDETALLERLAPHVMTAAADMSQALFPASQAQPRLRRERGNRASTR